MPKYPCAVNKSVSTPVDGFLDVASRRRNSVSVLRIIKRRKKKFLSPLGSIQ